MMVLFLPIHNPLGTTPELISDRGSTHFAVKRLRHLEEELQAVRINLAQLTQVTKNTIFVLFFFSQ
jgi:hypothetical protein